MESAEYSRCPRCGAEIDRPFFYRGPPNVCRACGWGQARKRPGPAYCPPLVLTGYWIAALAFIIGPYIGLRNWLFPEILAYDRIGEFICYYAAFWVFYAMLGGLLELKANLDWYGVIGGVLINPRLFLTVFISTLFFPGRLVAKTLGNTFRTLRAREREKKSPQAARKRQ